MIKMNINKILLYIIAAIVIFIIAVSAIALCTKNLHPGEGLRREDPLPESLPASKTAFTKIGQIRVFTKPESEDEKSVVLLVPWFEYDGSDNTFYEELDRKHQSIKAIFTSYLARHTKSELISMGDEKIKMELMQQVNDSLVLGKISNIYFNDYFFLD